MIAYCTNFRNVPDGKIYSKRYVSRTLNELLKSLSNLDQGMNIRRENHFNDISLKTALRLAGWESYDDNLKQALEYFMLDFQNGIEPNDVSAGVYSVSTEGIIVKMKRVNQVCKHFLLVLFLVH